MENTNINNDLEQNNEDDLPLPDEMDLLKARANLLNIKFHPSISLEKLRDKVNGTVTDAPVEEVKSTLAQKNAVVEETLPQRRARKKKEANELVRVIVSCMNPAKKEWDGEIITAGNSLVGSFKKFIPFDNEEGWHIPRMIYNQLVQRQCQIFQSVKDKVTGRTTRRSKLIREFNVVILDPLSPNELHDLAQRQAMAKSID